MKKAVPAALSVFIAVVTAAFILSLGIAVPILIRPFYTAQIDSLNLEQTTGLTRQQIIEAYDEVLDYCTGVSDTFGTGVLSWSPSGKAHFDDVRKLFLLDLRTLLVSAAVLIVTAVVCLKSPVKPAKWLGHAPCFYSAVTLLTVFALVGIAMFCDFDAVFTAFHTVFFPGKDNWIFDARKDEVIRILPESFFLNCAILILAVIAVLCAACIVGSMISKRRRKTLSASRPEPPAT